MNRFTKYLQSRQRTQATARLLKQLAKITERENHAKYDYEATVLWANHARDRARRDFEARIAELNYEVENDPHTRVASTDRQNVSVRSVS
jgi:hypothetical protein